MNPFVVLSHLNSGTEEISTPVAIPLRRIKWFKPAEPSVESRAKTIVYLDDNVLGTPVAEPFEVVVSLIKEANKCCAACS